MQAKREDSRIVQDIKSRHLRREITTGVVRLRTNSLVVTEHKKPEGLWQDQGVPRRVAREYLKTAGKF